MRLAFTSRCSSVKTSTPSSSLPFPSPLTATAGRCRWEREVAKRNYGPQDGALLAEGTLSRCPTGRRPKPRSRPPSPSADPCSLHVTYRMLQAVRRRPLLDGSQVLVPLVASEPVAKSRTRCPTCPIRRLKEMAMGRAERAIERDSRRHDVPMDMAFVPGGTFTVGSDRHYPRRRPSTASPSKGSGSTCSRSPTAS